MKVIVEVDWVLGKATYDIEGENALKEFDKFVDYLKDKKCIADCCYYDLFKWGIFTDKRGNEVFKLKTQYFEAYRHINPILHNLVWRCKNDC